MALSGVFENKKEKPKNNINGKATQSE